MNKIAIFVEGQTEQIFTEKLVCYLGSNYNIGIQMRRMYGGKRVRPRMVIEISGTNETTNQDYFILIVDCGNDERVKSDIIDHYNGLIENNYQVIVGIRDVFPSPRNNIQRLREGFAFRLPKDPVEPILVLAIMEVEAWFLAEHSHFLQIHPSLTIDRIKQNFGFNPSIDDVQLRDRPSKDLEDIYILENIDYHKTREHIERTVNILDFIIIIKALALGISDLGNLVNTIRHFFGVLESSKPCKIG